MVSKKCRREVIEANRGKYLRLDKAEKHKPEAFLKSQIPLQVYTPWDEHKPGFMDIDLVPYPVVEDY